MMATRSLWCTRDAKNESDSTVSTRLKASQPFTNPAKLFDSELCCRKEVGVEVKGLDRYQRTIADVIFARRPDSKLRDREGRFVVQAVRALVPAPGMRLQSADCGRIGKGTIEKCPFAFLGRYRSPVVAKCLPMMHADLGPVNTTAFVGSNPSARRP
jgi:hypothetical protein